VPLRSDQLIPVNQAVDEKRIGKGNGRRRRKVSVDIFCQTIELPK
jgi:hypothetical protein